MYNFEVKSLFHNYEVKFIDNFPLMLQGIIEEGDFIIIDKRIEELYKGHLLSVFKNVKYISLTADEIQKSYQGVIPVIAELIENGFKKNHRLIAIGGGIIQDITAFISSIIYRGVDWFFFPTTLLAQCDSCIGSKTSINFSEYKNQLGGFYPPNKVYIYLPFIDTLSEGAFKSGMGEMLHYFIVSGKADFVFYRENYKEAFTNKVVLSQLIKRSLEIKKSYIEMDEFDKNIRQVFNYGHSFGHAIESLSNYKIPHGIAVSYGMDIANYISMKMDFIPSSIRNEIREVVEVFWPDFPINYINVDSFINALSKDKKNVGTKLGLILNKGYGDIFKNIIDVDDNFIAWLNEYFNNELI